MIGFAASLVGARVGLGIAEGPDALFSAAELDLPQAGIVFSLPRRSSVSLVGGTS